MTAASALEAEQSHRCRASRNLLASGGSQSAKQRTVLAAPRFRDLARVCSGYVIGEGGRRGPGPRRGHGGRAPGSRSERVRRAGGRAEHTLNVRCSPCGRGDALKGDDDGGQAG